MNSLDTAPLAGKVVYAVDANSLIFQVFHAIPEMTSPSGEPTNAIFGFVRDMLAIIETKKPDFLLVAFDLHGPTFRHTLYTDYKGHRTEMPADLIPQIPAIQRFLEALAIPVLGVESFEADDLLATIAHRTEEGGGLCYVVTADKDCRQLISDRVKVYNVRKNQVYDERSLAADWKIRPDQVVDFQALVGDPVDNVPGVPLIGPKVASELLAQYGTLEGVFEHAAEVSGAKRRENLINGRETAMLSRQLVRLDRHVPFDIDWEAARVGGIDVPRFIELCRECGFHRLHEQVKALVPAAATSDWKTEYTVVDTPEKLSAFVAELTRQPLISIDTETTHINPAQAELVGISIAWKEGHGYYLPIRAPEGERRLDEAATLAALRPCLENASIAKLGQNLKYDMIVFRAAGVTLRGVAFDTMVASYLLDAGERIHNLDELAKRYLNHTTIKISELIGSGKNQKRMDEAPVEAIAAYASEDADVPLRLRPILADRLRADELETLFNELEMPLVEVLAELEFNGIRVDVPRLEELGREFGARIESVEREIFSLAGREFNIASPKQLQRILFEELKLPVISRTKTGPSTDADTLEELAQRHALPAKIIEYRQYAKLKGTYVDALPTMVNPRTGRVHCSFHQAVAATGRLSSSDPNLQNIPIRTETGRAIRSAFLPAQDDWSLLAADYSQIELRMLAHLSQDDNLCRAFEQDQDIHTLVASQVYGVAPDQVTRDMRRGAKAVNFGVIYGQSPFGLAKALDIEKSQAAEFIDQYFARYPGVDLFLTKTLEDCVAKGYVTTIMGRRRAIRGIRSTTGRQRNLPERTAINTVIQGSAADLIKLAMIAVHGRMRGERLESRMLLQIHDELMFETHSRELETLRTLVAHEMSSVMRLAVPLKVDVKVGRNWAEVEAV